MKHTRLFFITIFTFCLSLAMRAQTTPTATPVTSTEGYDFVATFLPNGSAQRKSLDLRLQFLISSREDNVVRVECGNDKPEYEVPAGSTKVIDINSDYAYWDITDEQGQVEKPINLGVHIYSKNGKKMTVYAINQNGSKSISLDGSHVLPTQALGREYIISCDSDETMATEFVVMSTQKNTKVNIQLPAGVKTSKGSSSIKPLTATFSQPYMIYIVRVAVNQADPSSTLDLSGTTICADKPVAVWIGNQAARFTPELQNATADHAFDQLLPIDRWGQEFIVPMTGLKTRLNKLNIIARDADTEVKLISSKGTEKKTLGAAGKWSRLVDAYHGQTSSWATLEDSTFYVTANKPILVYLYTSSAIYNINKDEDDDLHYFGDPSMTMIAPLAYLTDTAIFSTYKNPIATTNPDPTDEDVKPMKYELVVWAKSSLSLMRNGNPVPTTLFKAVPGTSNYKYARIPISSAEEGYQILTAADKGFGGYVCGIENGQACLYPIGYDFLPVLDSLFVSKKYGLEDKNVHGGEYNAKYPDKADGGGWYLDKVELPNQPTQYDTIFICDSTKLRFPAIIHNDWKEIKWEIMRLNPTTHKVDSAYTKTTAQERDSNMVFPNPFYETRFFVLPEKIDKNGKPIKPEKRHPYEDFEVRAILYREPLICDLPQEQWPQDTLSTIVRTYRSYNDTTWLIKCTNDDDLTKIDDYTYEYEYFVNPDKTKETITLSVGENLNITRKYTTVNGCEEDSIVTLCVLLCQSEVEEREAVYICEKDLEGINSEFGEFFQTFDFSGTLKSCKKNNKGMSGNGWTWTPKILSADLCYWIFKGTDVIRTEDCNTLMQKWHDEYGATYPRATIGCDKSLTITLNVWPITEYTHDDITTCEKKVTWDFEYNWYDGHFTKNTQTHGPHLTYEPGKDGIHEGTNVVTYDYPRTTYPSEFKDHLDHNCIGERHIVNITFISKDQTIHKKNIELCNDDPILVVNKTSDPNIADDMYEWTFDPKDYNPGVHTSPIIECVNSKGCEYQLQYVITVNPVEIHYDTVVYCYEDDSKVRHTWSGHPTFWANIKGQTTKTQYHDAIKPLEISRPKRDPNDQNKDTRIVYELADTLYGNPCHVIYYQTVIVLPPYYTSEQRAAISTKQWFEWHDVIWAGELVDTDTIPNPQGKTISVLESDAYGRVVAPEGWEARYTEANHTYALKTTTLTKTYLHDNGSRTEPCDSTVELLVQVYDEQEEYTYAYVCNNDTPFIWQAGDTTFRLNLAEYQDPATLPAKIQIEEHRKTVASLWPVAGIPAHFYLDLTVYPSYLTEYEDHACQEIGGTKTFKDIEFKLDKADTLIGGNPLKTKPKIWINPETLEKVNVECDSGEVVRMIVHPIYTKTVNKELSTYEYTLYSHDTLRFFTEPEVLFVGKDFLATHPEISDLEALKIKAGVDSILLIDETFVPQLAVQQAWGGFFDTLQVSSGTAIEACDSTTFLDLVVRKTYVLDPVNLGDNGNVLDKGVTLAWSFGGDPTGNRRFSTFPLVSGDYFRFYYDENGNVVVDENGNPIEVDYTEGYDRAKGKDYHCNEDGTRTYLLIDSVLNYNPDGSVYYDVYVQYVTVYPTFVVVDYDAIADAGTVCVSDTYHWDGHFDVVVSDYVLTNRHAIVRDTLPAKRYEGYLDAFGNPIRVDSICILDLTVVGNGKVERTYSRCFNDPAWYPEWATPTSAVCYDVNTSSPELITNTIPSDPTVPCVDTYIGTINFTPAYGVAPCSGMNAYYQATYIEPYNYDTILCQHDKDFHWLLKNGEEHIPSNLYLYDEFGNPINCYGNTNKVPDNMIPSDLAVGTYIVRDSLKTVGCYCDSVLTLNYELREALEPVELDVTICQGETYILGDTVLRTEDTYTRFVQEEGKPCKTLTTVHLTVVKPSSFTVESSPVCFGDADTELTYAISYKYKGKYPTSFSVYYDEGAKDLGFKDIIDQKIERPESEWKVDSVYVLDLPIPMLDSKEDYPEPGVYSATIGFKNGVCAGEELMTYTFEVKINYPGWIMEQRHNDLIVLLNADHNGGYEWTEFQWYRNGQKMYGYTKPYLYVPEGLVYESEGSASYYVVLTETDANGEVISSAPTCPITVQYTSSTNPGSDHGPSSEYIAVTPTCVPRGGSIHILALNENSSGEYRITTAEGQFVSRGKYQGAATPVSIPSVEGLYIVQVWSDNKESKESYRAIKVIVRDTCPNCDKSSF